MDPENQLKKHTVQPTAVRTLVLKVFLEKGTALSLTELENILPHADKSSLFRTLKRFEKANIIHMFDDGTGQRKYGLCTESCDNNKDHQHFHFNCENCRETFCLSDIQVPPIHLPHGFEIHETNLVLKGVCSQCSNR